MAAVWASYQDSLIDEAGVVMQPSRQAQVESVEYSSIVRVPAQTQERLCGKRTQVGAVGMATIEHGGKSPVATFVRSCAAQICARFVTFTGA